MMQSEATRSGVKLTTGIDKICATAEVGASASIGISLPSESLRHYLTGALVSNHRFTSSYHSLSSFHLHTPPECRPWY